MNFPLPRIIRINKVHAEKTTPTVALFGSSIPNSLFISKMFFRSLRKKNAKLRGFFTSCGTHVNGSIIAILYTQSIGNPHSIGNQM